MACGGDVGVVVCMVVVLSCVVESICESLAAEHVDGSDVRRLKDALTRLDHTYSGIQRLLIAG